MTFRIVFLLYFRKKFTHYHRVASHKQGLYARHCVYHYERAVGCAGHAGCGIGVGNHA